MVQWDPVVPWVEAVVWVGFHHPTWALLVHSVVVSINPAWATILAGHNRTMPTDQRPMLVIPPHSHVRDRLHPTHLVVVDIMMIIWEEGGVD